MDLEHLLRNDVVTQEPKLIDGCRKLVKPLFEDLLIEPGDLLVLSVTEALLNFPLHAIENDSAEPLIWHHPVVYEPSLSVLHKCYWTRHSLNKRRPNSRGEGVRSLVLGGINSTKHEDDYRYGLLAVQKIASIVHAAPETTFVGAAATLDNFRAHVSDTDLLHVHLHTNSRRHGDRGTASPLKQALKFNDARTLSAHQILDLQTRKGAHMNLIACASGQQGRFDQPPSTLGENPASDEVMGLVPAFLFAGVASLTSTLWPIQDEPGAVFSYLFFRELIAARSAAVPTGCPPAAWVDLAEAHRAAVLEVRRIYRLPSAWAGFVLSGYWMFPFAT